MGAVTGEDCLHPAKLPCASLASVKGALPLKHKTMYGMDVWN